jgi:hypothetical protein
MSVSVNIPELRRLVADAQELAASEHPTAREALDLVRRLSTLDVPLDALGEGAVQPHLG